MTTPPGGWKKSRYIIIIIIIIIIIMNLVRLQGWMDFRWNKVWYDNVGVAIVRLSNVCFHIGVVHMDWRGACIAHLYKGKRDNCECSNSRGIVC